MKPDLMTLLTEWHKRIMAAEAQMNALYVVIGFDCNSPFINAIALLSDAYTQSISALVGDKDKWLDWYWLENEMGKSGHSAKAAGQDLHPIKTLEDLAGLIEASRVANTGNAA